MLYCCFWSSFVHCQDILIKQNGDELTIKIIEVTSTEVKFKNFDNIDGPTYILLKHDIFMIKYQSGAREIFKEETKHLPQISTNSQIQKSSELLDSEDQSPGWNFSYTNLRSKGENDANLHYRKYTGAASGSFYSGFCLGPFYGLIAPAIISSNYPETENLGYPDEKLFQDPIYRQAYMDRSYKIKRKKVWNNYFAGAGLSTCIFILFVVYTFGH